MRVASPVLAWSRKDNSHLQIGSSVGQGFGLKLLFVGLDAHSRCYHRSFLSLSPRPELGTLKTVNPSKPCKSYTTARRAQALSDFLPLQGQPPIVRRRSCRVVPHGCRGRPVGGHLGIKAHAVGLQIWDSELFKLTPGSKHKGSNFSLDVVQGLRNEVQRDFWWILNLIS